MHEKITKFQGPEIRCRSDLHPGTKLNDKNIACDGQMLGSLLRGSSAIGIWPMPVSPYIGLSWSTLSSRIRKMQITSACETFCNDTRIIPRGAAHGIKASIAEKLDSLETQMAGLEIESFK